MTTGRYAPSPSGTLHLGNLRTALLAWLFARSEGGRFLMRVEDLDQVATSPDVERSQLEDLAVLGLDWDGPIVRQSERFARYEAALADLEQQDLLYECFCSRREIREASVAPHGESFEGAYPGTCLNLTAAERAAKAVDRPAALRIRAEGVTVTANDLLHGPTTRVVDDFVVRRNEGTPSYNLAVVVDDAAQGVDQVVRGDDLLDSTPRQVFLAGLLGVPAPDYAHVPMVLGPSGERLAKRDGAITLADLAERGVHPPQVLAMLARSLGLAFEDEIPPLGVLLDRFNPSDLPTEPWQLRPDDLV